MKANELRIGNLVTDEFYDSFKTIIKVDSINESGINLTIQDDGNYPELAQNWIEGEYLFDKLRPIPLTEEWLLKMGFIRGIDYGELGISFGRLDFFWSGKFIYIRYNDNRNNIINLYNINNVHDLQNLYWCLCGEELEIKLEK